MEPPIYPEHNQSLVETNLPTFFFCRIYVNLGQINGAIATIPQYWALYPSLDHGTHCHKIILYICFKHVWGHEHLGGVNLSTHLKKTLTWDHNPI